MEEYGSSPFPHYFHRRFAGGRSTVKGGILTSHVAEEGQEAGLWLWGTPACFVWVFTEGLFCKHVSVAVSGQSSAGQRDGSLQHQPLPGGTAASW